jgi:uncharacterized damage-inducible protein DinB
MLESKKLALFSRAVRESTLKRLRPVPEGYENWRISSKAMSFADMAQHLIDADNWLLKMLSKKNLKPMVGRLNLVKMKDRNQYEDLLGELEQTGDRRSSMLDKIADEELSEMIHDDRFGSEVSAWWIIMRGCLDHEIHHRGQISAYLRAIDQSN